MSSNPTKRAYLKWDKANAGEDFLQLSDSTGRVSGWIDSNGLLNGALIPVGGTTPFAGVPTGTCTATQTAVNSGTGDLYSCSNGVWIKTGPTAGSLVSPITSPNPVAFDVDMSFKGPNPWVDVREFGVRSVNVNVIPSIPGITVSINSGSASAAISAASTFQNGDGVILFGAGTTHAMATPGAPTVTPSLAAALTGTGFTAVGPSGGATTYNYQIVARNKTGGLTAASAVGTTAIGAASLGAQSVGITSYARSGTTVTVTTSAPHGLSVGSMINQLGSTDPTNFSGWFSVATVADNTHYTYVTGLDTSSGASASATGGTANWFNCNHLTWTGVTGAWEYYIYGRTGGSLTLLGVSKPDNGQSVLYWDDFGSPMMDNYNAPFFVPTTPPGAAGSNHLSTTISSGAGTTTLTLANTAGTTVAAVTILFDSAPGILAAATSARNNGGTLYLPAAVGTVVNSYLTLPGIMSTNMAAGMLLNDTLELGAGHRWFGALTPQNVSLPSFAWEGQNVLTVGRANPGIYCSLTSGNSPSIRGVSFITNQLNNYSHVFLEGDFNNLEWVNFSGGSTNADLMGTLLTLRGTNVNSAFPNSLRGVSFLTPQGAANTSATPAFFCNMCGLTLMETISMGGRGMAFSPPPSGSDLQITGGRLQGSQIPFVTMIASTGGTVGGNIKIEGFELDTMAHAMLANLPVSGAGAWNVLLVVAGAPSGVPFVTGNPISRLTMIPGLGNSSAVGQNTTYADLSTGFFSNNTVGVNGVLGGLGFLLPTPSAPVSAVVSAGGAVGVGAHNYSLTAVDSFGRETSQSASTQATTSGGNQTVTITPPVLPLGSVGWIPYRDGQRVNPGTTVLPGVAAVDTAGFTVGPGGPFGIALQSGVTASGTEAIVLALAPVTFAQLGTPSNFTIKGCSDCTVANPCASGGTGAIAKRLNGAWVCN